MWHAAQPAGRVPSRLASGFSAIVSEITTELDAIADVATMKLPNYESGDGASAQRVVPHAGDKSLDAKTSNSS